MENRPCHQCGNDVPIHFKFCGFCGAGQQPVEASQEAPAAQSAASLVLIKGEGIEGESYSVSGDGMTAGRIEGDLQFPDDKHVSPLHARFSVGDGQVTVADEGSVNGVYFKLNRPEEIGDMSFIICGEQVLQFRVPKTDLRLIGDNGTYFYGSPMPQVYFQLIQVLPGGKEGAIYAARKRVITIGREDCDLNFPSDRFMSRYHTKFEVQKGKFLLYDLESRNGTFLRIDGEKSFNEGDQFFLGRQLLRVDFN